MAAYGTPPEDCGALALPSWQEFMHYLYLPVRIPGCDQAQPGGSDGVSAIMLPQRLAFLRRAIWTALESTRDGRTPHLADPYVYITARRGYATPGNPLNRPGWHCDDFGGTDLNFIWTDRWPTRFLVADKATGGLSIPSDDAGSMDAMRESAEAGYPDVRVEPGPVEHLLRLTPYVIHDTPIIEAPGGMRSFFKISVSTHRYNLIGNSHNHALDYDWPMYDRAAVRNQPSGNSDYVAEPAGGAL